MCMSIAWSSSSFFLHYRSDLLYHYGPVPLEASVTHIRTISNDVVSVSPQLVPLLNIYWESFEIHNGELDLMKGREDGGGARFGICFHQQNRLSFFGPRLVVLWTIDHSWGSSFMRDLFCYLVAASGLLPPRQDPRREPQRMDSKIRLGNSVHEEENREPMLLVIATTNDKQIPLVLHDADGSTNHGVEGMDDHDVDTRYNPLYSEYKIFGIKPRTKIVLLNIGAWSFGFLHISVHDMARQ